VKVHLFIPCMVDELLPRVAEATVRVLWRAGCEVVWDDRQTCCGQPAFNAGYRDDAAAIARRFIRVFGDAEAVVAPSGSCVGMVRTWYRELAPHFSAGELDALSSLRARIFELSELLVVRLGIEDLGASLAAVATWHDSCHMLRDLGVAEPPRRLLAQVRGLRMVPLADSDRCCGFGGAFSVKMPELSSTMGEDKARRIVETGAQLAITGDAGCLLQMQGVLARLGAGTRVVHLAEVLASEGRLFTPEVT
jgi:L-lactate dehydrogenase complex protein LldE